MKVLRWTSVFVLVTGLLIGCASTEIIESPRTAYVPDSAESKLPNIVWTSRTLTGNFDYLGLVKVRSWTYQGAMERLQDAGKELKADALIDIHYEEVGFLSSMHAFAIKYR